MRVFIAEDEAVVAMVLEEILLDLGHEVVASAANIRDAQSVATATAFDLAILDVNLNGHDTFELAQSLASRGVPTCLATGYGADHLPPQFSSFPLLGKPYAIGDVKAVIGKLAP